MHPSFDEWHKYAWKRSRGKSRNPEQYIYTDTASSWNTQHTYALSDESIPESNHLTSTDQTCSWVYHFASNLFSIMIYFTKETRHSLIPKCTSSSPSTSPSNLVLMVVSRGLVGHPELFGVIDHLIGLSWWKLSGAVAVISNTVSRAKNRMLSGI